MHRVLVVLALFLSAFPAWGGTASCSQGKVWEDHNRNGLIDTGEKPLAGIKVSDGVELVLTILAPAVWVTALDHAAPGFSCGSPAIFSMPVAFPVIWLVSGAGRSGRAALDRSSYSAQAMRQETGIGAEGSSGH